MMEAGLILASAAADSTVAVEPSRGILSVWWDILFQVWPVAAIAVGVTLLATPACRQIALRYGIVDRPDEFLKPHGKPMPYLGGVAVYLGWLAGLLVAMFSPQVNVRAGLMSGVIVAGLAIMLIGLFDDMRVMRPTAKLACNIAVAVWLLCLGLGDELVQVMVRFLLISDPLPRWQELVYSVPVMLLLVVGACNAANLIDGLDGLCAGVLGIIAAGFLILALNLRGYSNEPIENERIVLALAMLGAAVGFLPFNRNPAKIFLGDAGSMLLGLNAAVLLLLFSEERLVRWMMASLMVFGLPLADMLLTLARRWRNGRPLMQGDRSHFYDQLRDRGLSVRRVVAISYLLTLLFVLVGVSTIFLRTRDAFMVYGLAAALVVGAVWKFDMVSIDRGHGERAPGDEVTGGVRSE